MGFSAKKSKKVQDTDSDSDGYNDDMEYEEVARDEDDYDEDDGAEEEEEDDDEEEEQEGEEDGEEEEEEEGEEEEDEDREVGTDEEEDEAVERIERENEEMEQLEKEYRELHHQEIDTLKNLKHHKDEDLLKGQAVKSQKALWYKILELRFLLQKPFSSSNRLPQDPIKSSFCESDETVSVAYSNLVTSSKETLDSILELQEALFAKNPSITQATYGSERLSKDLAVSKQLDDNFDQEWSQISQTHKRIASFRDKSINKWQRMTQVTTGAAAIKGKLHAFNQDLSNQIATYMRDPSRMMKQMQLRKSSISIFGSVPEAKDNTEEEALTDADPELLDDSEFYQQLLKEFFETVDPSSSEKAFYALKRMQTKKRKIVDRRASKSRKIRYNVHEKIVNFMAPQPMNLPPMAPMLFDNLFGLKTES